MPKVKISEYSATANSNTDVASINIDEGCAPSGINNAIRAVMGHLKDFQQGTNGDPFNGPVNGTLGATTASTANVTTLTTSSTVTHNGGTANGVAYLNGSKVLTTGSALVFDGTNLGVGVTPTSYATVKAIQLNTASTLMAFTNEFNIGQNVYYNAGNKYITTGAATMYAQTTGQHQWFNAASGIAGNAITFTQAMTLDASGNLGVGTTSPTVVSNYKSVTVNGTTGGLVDLASNGTVGLRLQCDTTYPGGALFTLTNQPMILGTNGTERARIDSSGNLLVGDTTTIGTGGKFQVKSSTDTSLFKCTSSTTYAAIVSNVENTAARLMAFQYGSGGSPTNVGTITTNGTGVTYGTSSDYRLKENIVPMTGALDKVAQLKPVTYKWKINGSDGQGFIAHELAEVVPDAVQGEKDAIDADGNPTYQGIDTSYLVATLTAAIQEQSSLITQLTARITALESA